MIRVNFHLTNFQIKKLKHLSKQTELKVAELIRRAIDEFLKDELSIFQHRVEYGKDSNPVYSGKAELGKAITEPKWQITKLIYDSRGRVHPQYPNGNKGPKFKWSERSKYSYRRMK